MKEATVTYTVEVTQIVKEPDEVKMFEENPLDILQAAVKKYFEMMDDTVTKVDVSQFKVFLGENQE